MNTPASPADQHKTSAIIYGVIGSLIATALVAAGAWLAPRQVPDETVLQFSYSEVKVGHLSSWLIRITNGSEVAFEVQLTPPSSTLISYEYSPKGEGATGWKGQIAKGKTIEALFVLEDSSANLSPTIVQGLIAATYQERNSQTGAIETRNAEVREMGALPVVRTVLLVFWFLLPTLAAIALFLAPRAFRFFKARFQS